MDTSNNGTVLIKYPQFAGSTKNIYCTGVLLNRYWVLTAKHCLDYNVPMYIYYYGWTGGKYDVRDFKVNNQSFNYTDAFGSSHYSQMDIALLELPLKSNVSSARIPYMQRSQIYAGTDMSLVGKQVRCEGFGYGRMDPYGNGGYDSSSIGQLRYSVNPVTWVSNDLGYSHLYVDMNSKWQAIANGDSGGTCFYYENGVKKITGINSYATINVSSGQTSAGTYQTAPSVFREWVNQILNPKMTISTTSGTYIGFNQNYNLPSVPVNSIVTQTFRIRNSGTGPLFLGNQSYNSPLIEIYDYSSPACMIMCPSWSEQFTVTQQPNYRIAENNYTDFQIQFKATQPGTYTIMVQAYTTDPAKENFYFFVKGTAR